jgi:4a-hydroxytetrahydrobiopterin dehydratase
VLTAEASPKEEDKAMPKLDQDGLQAALRELTGWELKDGELRREVKLKDFRNSLSFVEQVADLAEAAGHHPDIDIRYNRVRLALVTHDAGGITEKDVALARQINRLLDA